MATKTYLKIHTKEGRCFYADINQIYDSDTHFGSGGIFW